MGKLANIFNRTGQLWEIGEKKSFFVDIVAADAPYGYLYKHESKLIMEHTRLLVLRSGKASELFKSPYILEECVHICLARDQLVSIPEYYFNASIYYGWNMLRLV